MEIVWKDSTGFVAGAIAKLVTTGNRNRQAPAARRRPAASTAAIASVALACAATTDAAAQELSTFGVLAGSTITNTGPTVIEGNVGLSPGSAITGFPPGTVTPPFATFQNDAVAAQAQSDLTTAYNILANRPATQDLTSQDLGGLVLGPGVYNFDSSAQLTGDLTLDAEGDPNSVFVFNIGSTLTTASASSVNVINSDGAEARNVFYRVGSSATLGAATQFQGNIFALTSISLVTAASIDCGSALARNGAVTLDTNTIAVCPAAAEPDPDSTPDADTGEPAADEVLDAIGDATEAGDTVPIPFVVALGVLTPAEIAQLAGEVATGVAPSGILAMDSFMDLATQPRFAAGRMPTPAAPAPPVPEAPATPAPQPGTVRVLGFMPVAPSTGADFANFYETSNAGVVRPSRRKVWAGGYGGYGVTDGDASTGSHDRTSRNFGLAVGASVLVTPETEIGVALGRGYTSYDLADGFGDGDSKTLHAAIYGRRQIEQAYVAAALGYAYHDISTDRTLTVAGLDRFSADFHGHGVTGELEAGYGIGSFTPYAAVRVHSFRTPAYSETTEAGLSTFALDYEARRTTAARTELGFRVERSFELDDGASLALGGGAAWAHYWRSDTEADANFQALPGSQFTVAGAERSSDSLLLSAGAEVAFANGLALGGSVDGELAKDSRYVAGMARVSYRW